MFKQSFKTSFLLSFSLDISTLLNINSKETKNQGKKNASTHLPTLARLFADPTHRSAKIYIKYDHTMLKIKIADFCTNFQKERSRSSNEKSNKTF
jgi:hypothetical protein